MSKLLKRLAVTILVVCVLLIAGYVCRAPLLRGVASAWIVNEPLAKADVIVVLGGGPATRPFEAAKLYHQGLASRILVMQPKPGPASALGLIPSEAELTRQILINQGVPASALRILQNEVTSSYEESMVFRDWVKTNSIKSVIIPTDIFHTRRVRWLYRKELKSTGIKVSVDAVPVREYTARDWWRSEQGVVAFQNEVLKFAYYRLKY
jgi:uncharacterized SAM-binding protein YcdF (DUF218 family)